MKIDYRAKLLKPQATRGNLPAPKSVEGRR